MQAMPINFKQAAQLVKTLSKSPTDSEKLHLYSLYKQSLLGDCNVDKPWFVDPVGRAKWNAWNDIRGMSCDNAQVKYIELVEQLISRYGIIVSW